MSLSGASTSVCFFVSVEARFGGYFELQTCGGVAAIMVADSGDEVGALFLEVRQIGAGASLGMERRAPNQSGLDVTVVTEAAREA